MLSITRHFDVQVARLPRQARWFGIKPVSSAEGSIGIGIVEIVYSFGTCTRPLPAERVEPWLSSVD